MSKTSAADIRTACLALAERLERATGGHAHAQITELPDGSFELSYLHGCPHGKGDAFKLVRKYRMSISRVFDSLTSHVARALQANAEGLRITSLTLSTLTSPKGTALIGVTCPAWHAPVELACDFEVVKKTDSESDFLLRPHNRDQHLIASQSIGALYDAGIIRYVNLIISHAAKGFGELLALNKRLSSDISHVLFPGQNSTGAQDNHMVLARLVQPLSCWRVDISQQVPLIHTEGACRKIERSQEKVLTSTVARFQVLVEALGTAIEEAEG